MARVRVRRPLLALVVLVAALVVGYTVRAVSSDDHADRTPPSRSSTPSVSIVSTPPGGEVALSGLPVQVAQTVRLVKDGGPFPYPRNDGVVFHNDEHVLPREPDGWYHEYTVPTPGADTRGARRLVTGRDGAWFYTADHYAHFVRVDVNR